MMSSAQPAAHRLSHETSPYLLSHAHNPVPWYPWGEAAWQAAQQRDCPVLLSVGYAACHWCHVMERESFVDPDIAALLSADFVAIKVDREERPDIDAVYMAATQALNHGRGGWPMTLLLTPAKRPFFAGTYLPPDDRDGVMGFASLLRRAADLWRTARPDIEAQADAITKAVAQAHTMETSGAAHSLLSPTAPVAMRPAAQQAVDATAAVVSNLAASFDQQHGGFGPAPKFLATTQLRLLTRAGWQDGDRVAQHLVSHTLWHMTRGSLYDVIGGGFSRYSVDAAFRVPHFEKMLYDNALMVPTLLDAYSASGNPAWRRAAIDTLAFVGRNMRTADGAFVTAIDADSEGEEGRFYTWPFAEAQAALRAKMPHADAVAWLTALGITTAGNFEHGRNVVFAACSRDEQGQPRADGTSVPWDVVRRLLADARNTRVRPLTDDKVLLGHNGLMIGALAHAARVLGDARYLQWAEQATAFVWQHLRRPDQKMWRTWRAGRAQVLGMLEDYAYLADGLLAAYEAGASDEMLERAATLADTMLVSFAGGAAGALYDSDVAQPVPLFRPREGHDSATPSPNAVAMGMLWRLSVHTGDAAYAEAAERIFAAWQPEARSRPAPYSALWAARRDASAPRRELTWIGDGPPHDSALWRAGAAVYGPELVRAHGHPQRIPRRAWPLLRERLALPQAHKAGGVAFVCTGSSCQAPVTDAHTLRAHLNAPSV